VTISGRPLIEKTVIMVADSENKSPSEARISINSAISISLLYRLYALGVASLDSLSEVTDAVTAFIDDPRTLTLLIRPHVALDAESVASVDWKEGSEFSVLAELLNISVASNGGQAVYLQREAPPDSGEGEADGQGEGTDEGGQAESPADGPKEGADEGSPAPEPTGGGPADSPADGPAESSGAGAQGAPPVPEAI
jgi:hypothetical protein